MKYFIKTFGCQMNFSDSERIQTYLESNDFKPIENIDFADLVIFNTCGVRQTAEDRVYGHVHNLRKNNPKVLIVITGCLAHRKDVQLKLKNKADIFLPIKKIQKLDQYIKKLHDSGKSTKIKDGPSDNYLDLIPKYEKKESILVPIMTGCNNFCSYCVVPYARGRQWSRPFLQITNEIEQANQGSCTKVLLLGQNVNSYKYRKITFPILLDRLSKKYPKITFSFLTSHPKDFSDELIKVIADNKNISKTIHLPIQTGSDKILRAMNRHYTKKHYLEIIKKIKKHIPDARFSTDIIVGFPGETLNDFQKTVSVFKRINFIQAFVNKYSPRPGTAAEKLGDPIPLEEKKRRERELRSLLLKK